MALAPIHTHTFIHLDSWSSLFNRKASENESNDWNQNTGF